MGSMISTAEAKEPAQDAKPTPTGPNPLFMPAAAKAIAQQQAVSGTGCQLEDASHMQGTNTGKSPSRPDNPKQTTTICHVR